MKKILSAFVLSAFFLSSLPGCALFPQRAEAYKASDFRWEPPFFSQAGVKPTIHIILDNSGSMHQRAYEDTEFDPSASYYGYADPNKKYTYRNGCFEEDSSGQWSGKFLNWAMMHRLDVAKKVLIGGKYMENNGYYECEAVSPSAYPGVATFYAYENNAAGHVPSKYFEEDEDISINHTDDTIRMTISYTGWKSFWGMPYLGTITDTYNMRIKGPASTGVLDMFKGRARMSFFVFDHSSSYNGGRIESYVEDDHDTLRKAVHDVTKISNTPLAESLYTVCGYIQQKKENTYHNGRYRGPRYRGDDSYEMTQEQKGDPFYFSDEDEPGMIHCSKQKIILITDGDPTEDYNILDAVAPTAGMFYDEEGSDASLYRLDNVAYWAHTTNLRPQSDFEGLLPEEEAAFDTSAEIYAIYAAFGNPSATGQSLLKNACRHGAFPKEDGWTTQTIENYDPVYTETNKQGTYFEADDGEALEKALIVSMDIGSSQISGSATAPSPQGMEGDGATYQAIFFPPKEKEDNATFWGGQVHAFFTDGFGNLREDSDGNKDLDTSDMAIRYKEGQAFRHAVNASSGELIGDGDPVDFKNINYLWSSTDWLQQVVDPETQRTYNNPTYQRHIFTTVDKDQQMAGLERKDFVTTGIDVKSEDSFAAYLTLWESSGEPGPVPTAATDRDLLAEDQIKFIRGQEMTKDSLDKPVRSRTDKSGKKWLLGDIIYSTPTVVGAPGGNYFTAYKDRSYKAFYDKYRNRRQVVYVGANDCMLHAFNAGFFRDADAATGTRPGFVKSLDGEIEHALGAELWAYIPHNLLPHLRWLMNPAYNYEKDWVHIAGMDLKPYIFDARVFNDQDPKYPGGWGTILVAGMRLGGAEIQVDVTKEGEEDGMRTMSSAYVIMDVTDPEEAPAILGEIRLPRQGFTTCIPTAMPMARMDRDGTLSMNDIDSENDWYLVFGSGPADGAGRAHRDRLRSTEKLHSAQQAVLYALDLKALVQHNQVRYIDQNKVSQVMTSAQDPMHMWECTDEPKSMITSPRAVDLHKGSTNASLAMKADAVYFGTTSHTGTKDTGAMYRLYTDKAKGNAPQNWGVSRLIKTDKPIVAPVNISHSGKQKNKERLWIYFGTGRYFNQQDNTLTGMSFYGVKEPVVVGAFGPEGRPLIDWTAEVQDTDTALFPSANTEFDYSGGSLDTQVKVTNQKTGTRSWRDFEKHVAETYEGGWRYDLDPQERVTEEAAIFGGAAYFTTYTPTATVCTGGGFSRLYGLYFTTGTPYYKPIFYKRTTHDKPNPPYIDLGSGQASKPTVVTRKDDTTEIEVTKQDTTSHSEPVDSPLKRRSKLLYWQER